MDMMKIEEVVNDIILIIQIGHIEIYIKNINIYNNNE